MSDWEDYAKEVEVERDLLEAKHTALEDGLRELYEGSVQYQEFRSVYDGSLPVDPNVYLKIKRDELRELLGKESGDE